MTVIAEGSERNFSTLSFLLQGQPQLPHCGFEQIDLASETARTIIRRDRGWFSECQSGLFLVKIVPHPHLPSKAYLTRKEYEEHEEVA